MILTVDNMNNNEKEVGLIVRKFNGTYIVHSPEYDITKRDREFHVAVESVLYQCASSSVLRHGTKGLVYCKSIQWLNRMGVYRYGTYKTYVIK